MWKVHGKLTIRVYLGDKLVDEAVVKGFDPVPANQLAARLDSVVDALS